MRTRGDYREDKEKKIEKIEKRLEIRQDRCQINWKTREKLTK